MEKFNKIILNIPHSSFNGIFDANLSGWQPNANLINQMIKETDWHTDFIFTNESFDNKISPLIFNYSRFIVDVERLENDPLESIGRGIIYKKVGSFERNTNGDMVDRLMNLRNEHLNALSNEIVDNSIIIDCHSFNDEISSDVDICIGFNGDFSKPNDETINGIVDICKKAGYKVALNDPYGNSITPYHNKEYKSLMIEINKKCYLKNGLEINTSTNYAPRITSCLSKIYDYLLIQ